jgi:hypothetical protein
MDRLDRYQIVNTCIIHNQRRNPGKRGAVEIRGLKVGRTLMSSWKIVCYNFDAFSRLETTPISSLQPF